MSFRITQQSMARRTLSGLQMNLAKLGDLQQQLATGKQFSRPSQSPAGVTQSMRLRADIRSQQQYSANGADGLSWLGTIDSSLTGSLSDLHKARDLVLQGMSVTASGTPANREALAAEIDSIRQGMISVANTTYLGRPVFGGTTSGSVAYDASGTYVGDAGSVTRVVGDGVRVQADAPGPAVFGSGGTQLFTVLATIASDLRNNPAALDADLGQIDSATDTLQGQLADVGARYNRIDQMSKKAADRVIDLKSQLSDIEDIDLPKAITDLKLQETAYQAALAAASRVIQPSLLDFLK